MQIFHVLICEEEFIFTRYTKFRRNGPYPLFKIFLIWTLKDINFGIELISKSTTSSSFNGQDTNKIIHL